MPNRLHDELVENRYRFRVDRPLGKLAKWLRLLGYDTITDRFPHIQPVCDTSRRGDRIWIIRTQSASQTPGIISIAQNDPIQQLKTVITHLGIQRKTLKPFTRCIRCNHTLEAIDKGRVRGRVPDYIWEMHAQFRICSRCQKIFWRGSHVAKHNKIIDQLMAEL